MANKMLFVSSKTFFSQKSFLETFFSQKSLNHSLCDQLVHPPKNRCGQTKREQAQILEYAMAWRIDEGKNVDDCNIARSIYNVFPIKLLGILLCFQQAQVCNNSKNCGSLHYVTWPNKLRNLEVKVTNLPKPTNLLKAQRSKE